jgi:copper chaperone CopZ
MQTATTTARTLEIDGMHGDACVQKVTSALKDVQNVKTESVKVGSAKIDADKAGCAAACTAIGGAGFKAHEKIAVDTAAKAPAIPAEGTGNKPGAPLQGNQSHGGNHGDGTKPVIANAGSPAKVTETPLVSTPSKTATVKH